MLGLAACYHSPVLKLLSCMLVFRSTPQRPAPGIALDVPARQKKTSFQWNANEGRTGQQLVAGLSHHKARRCARARRTPPRYVYVKVLHGHQKRQGSPMMAHWAPAGLVYPEATLLMLIGRLTRGMLNQVVGLRLAAGVGLKCGCNRSSQISESALDGFLTIRARSWSNEVGSRLRAVLQAAWRHLQTAISL